MHSGIHLLGGVSKHARLFDGTTANPTRYAMDDEMPASSYDPSIYTWTIMHAKGDLKQEYLKR